MTKLKLAAMALWGASLIGAFILGQSWNKQDVVSTGEKPENYVNRDALSNFEGPSHLPLKVTKNEAEFEGDEADSQEQIMNLEQLADNFWQEKNVTGFSSTFALFKLIENLDQEQILALLDRGPSDLLAPEKFIQLQLLIARFSQVNPSEAMEYLGNMPLKEPGFVGLLHSTLMEWSAAEPIEAADWYMSNFSQYDKKLPYGLSASAVFENLAKQDPLYAMDMLSKLKQSDTEQFTSAVMGIAISLQQDQQYKELLSDPMVQDSALAAQSIVRSWAKHSPQSAAQWLGEVDQDKINPDLSATIMRNWLDQDPEQATNWFLAQEAQPNIEALGEHWSSTGNYQEALTWIKQSSHQVSPFAKGLFSRMLYRDPDFVIDNLGLLNKADSQEVTLQLYLWLQRTSAEKAQEFIADLPNKDDLLKQVARINQNRS